MPAQLAFNGLVTGLILALPALALTLTFGIARFPNFALGAMVTTGAYLAWAANVLAGLPLLEAAVLAALGLALVAMALDACAFRWLRERDGMTLMVASIGLSFVLENACRFAFGNDARSLAVEVARPMRWHGLRINHEQLTAAATVLVLLVLMHLLLHHTRLGRAMRAVADNAPLAAARGIERGRIVSLTWAIAGALVGVAAVLIALDRAIDPLLGWNFQIPVFAAAILGGLGSPVGAVLGALLIGLAEELSALVLPTQYRQAVGFGIILLLLLLRPHGLFGRAVIRR